MDDLELEVSDDLGLEDDSSPDTSDESPGGDSKTALESDESSASPSDDDDQQYSARVRKRIDKEVGRRKAAEANIGRLNADILTLRAELEQIKTRNAAADAQAVEGTLRAKLQSAQQRLKQAKEDGDTEAEVQALDEYVDLRDQQRRLERQRAESEHQSVRQPVAPSPPTGAMAWLARNAWYQQGQHPEAAAFAQQLDAQLQREGHSPNDAGMYDELNRRLVAAMPQMAPVVGYSTTQRTSANRQPGPPTGTSSVDGKSTGSLKRTLSKQDLADMSQYGLNPDNLEHRKIWLRNHQSQ